MNKERRLIIAGNWKMNKTVAEALHLVHGLKIELGSVKEVDLVVCPPFTALADVSKAIMDSNLRLGAQNMSEHNYGAFTGEIAAGMLKEFSVRYVILGHSERRQFYHETSELVAKKARAAHAAALKPIVCVGESLQEREGGKTESVLDTQVRGSLAGLTGAQIEGWYAPNISGDALSKLRDMSDQDLERFLRSGDMGNNTKVVGPMQEVVHASLSHLTDADLHAMVIYLKHQEAAPSPLAPAPVKWPRQADAQGLYQQQCAGCHQNDGKGIPGTVPALAGNDAVTASDPSNVVMAMLEGFPPQGPWGAMASFSNSLSDEQIADIANYVRTAWGNDASPNATPWGVDGWRKYAQSPKDESRALLCPDLDAKILKPALDAGATNLQKAAGDRIAMTQLVRKYQSVVPSASRGEVVEALSTAYCRTLSSGNLSEARMGAQLAEFAQRAAIATDDRKSM